MARPYKKIMVTLDGSTLAEEALPHAQSLACLSGAELVLFQAVPDLAAELRLEELSPIKVATVGERQHQLVDQATRALERLADNLQLHHLKATFAVDVGPAAEKIVDYASAHEIDLIVVNTHGRTGVRRWVLGSVAAKVIEAALCPVLLIRAPI